MCCVLYQTFRVVMKNIHNKEGAFKSAQFSFFIKKTSIKSLEVSIYHKFCVTKMVNFGLRWIQVRF